MNGSNKIKCAYCVGLKVIANYWPYLITSVFTLGAFINFYGTD